MASFFNKNPIFILTFLILISINYFTVEAKPFSLSFPLTLSPNTNNNAAVASSLARRLSGEPSPPFNYSSKTPFKYSMALIVSLPIGTPPQLQPMVVDTGSQLSWIQCHRKQKPAAAARRPSFDPSLSSSFSPLPCAHPACKPRIPDFTLPTSCDQNRLCHYSYFYADGTLAEGNLVREKFAFSGSRSTPPLILGCAVEAPEAEGILGMNLGRLSFASQAKVPKFSYCAPLRRSAAADPTGTFYLGQNPNSRKFRYTDLLTFPNSQRSPNFDPLAYTVGLTGIKIGGRRLNISESAFRPDSGGSGQTIVDSGTQYTFLVDSAYEKVREEVVRAVGGRMKKGYSYGGALDMCFEGVEAPEIGRLVGDVAFEFGRGLEISIGKERITDEVGGGVRCIAVGRSEALGVASNILGNFHQQNLWVEFDLVKKRVGFGVADCSKSGVM